MNNQCYSRFAVISLMLILLMGLTFSLLTGCSTTPSPGTPAAPGAAAGTGAIHLYFGADTSGSFQPHLPEITDLLLKIIRFLTPGRDHLTVLKLDSDCEEVFDGFVPESGETFEPVLISAFNKVPVHSGTHPEAFFDEVVQRAAQQQGPCAVVFGSDGDFDGVPEAGKPAIDQAAKALAADSKVRAVILVGIMSENRHYWRKHFSALDRSRRLFFLNLDANTAAGISDILDSAQQAGAFTPTGDGQHFARRLFPKGA